MNPLTQLLLENIWDSIRDAKLHIVTHSWDIKYVIEIGVLPFEVVESFRTDCNIKSVGQCRRESLDYSNMEGI